MFKNMSIKLRLIMVISLLASLLVAVGTIALVGMHKTNKGLKTVYEDRTVPMGQLADLRRMGLGGLLLVADSLQDPTPAEISKHTALIDADQATTRKIWDAYLATYLTPEEAVLAKQFGEDQQRYVDDGLTPAIAALRAGDIDEAKVQFEKANTLYAPVAKGTQDLMDLQLDVAKAEYTAAQHRYTTLFGISSTTLILGTLVAGVCAFFLLRAIVRPLKAAVGYFEKIGEGHYQNDIRIDSMDEAGRVLAALKTMQCKLHADVTEAKRVAADFGGQFDAISKAQAVIEFSMDGKIISANENFLNTMGYSLTEIQGQHHSIFVEPAFRASADYRQFWDKLNRGEYDGGQYKRIGKGGKEVWIRATYNPIVDEHGKPCKVVKFASDITDVKLKYADCEGQIAAISKAQAVVEFKLDGTLVAANENFCRVLGYAAEELKGKHHSMIADPAYSARPEYRHFWDKLSRGEYDAGQYKYVGRGGKEVWVQASYNPILDMNGTPFKVVNYATDITEQVMCTNDMGRVLGALAKGDLTETVTREYTGAFRQVRADANAAVAQLSQIIAQINEATESITTASREIADGNADLAERTAEESSSIQETASSMEELTSTVKQNADNATQANQLAASASTVAVKGGQVVDQVVETMGSINEASKKIVEIISVIDGIAFQTNILALNAAVEAARAGEQGRGFAVVASEVRSLAQRSAAAAKEIKRLIGDSVERVDSGSKLVDQAGKTMEEIVGSIKRVTDIMAEITAASQEQSIGIEHVSQAIAQMDQVTQQNAALVEQAAAAAESLQEQAQTLSGAVGMFRLDSTQSVTVERRGPNRATNVERIAPTRSAAHTPVHRPAPLTVPSQAKTGTDDEWTEF
jgi:methyl-accepting chemotaxis protein